MRGLNRVISHNNFQENTIWHVIHGGRSYRSRSWRLNNMMWWKLGVRQITRQGPYMNGDEKKKFEMGDHKLRNPKEWEGGPRISLSWEIEMEIQCFRWQQLEEKASHGQTDSPGSYSWWPCSSLRTMAFWLVLSCHFANWSLRQRLRRARFPIPGLFNMSGVQYQVGHQDSLACFSANPA